METNDFFSLYYQEVEKIFKICSDLDIYRDDTKLFSLIHIKALKSKEGSNYFRKNQEEDIIALSVMLGEVDTVEIFNNLLANQQYECFGILKKLLIADNITKIDNNARKNYGLEFNLRSELRQRMRLYVDYEFREEKLKIYDEKILPRIN